MEITVEYTNVPREKGIFCIYPEILDGNVQNVVIVGDPKGLTYLSDILKYVADIQQEIINIPVGERAHIHLTPDMQMGSHSCSVEICRADARGTKELPKYMK